MIANQRFIRIRNFLRSTVSARAPAGSVKRKNGSEATVDMSDIRRGDEVSVFITHVVAVSWAATHVPETRLAAHNFLNTGFCKALQVEAVDVVITYTTVRFITILHAVCAPIDL